MSDERTISAIILQTIGLRLIVGISQAALLHLQGHEPNSFFFRQKIVLYTILPLTGLIDYTAQLIQFFRSLSYNTTRRTLQFALLQLAGLRIRIDTPHSHKSPNHEKISLQLCDSRKIIRQSRPLGSSSSSHGGNPRLTHLAKVLAAGAALAHTLSVFILITRRIVLVLHSWLALDVWNAVAALNGTIAAVLVLVLLLFTPSSPFKTAMFRRRANSVGHTAPGARVAGEVWMYPAEAWRVAPKWQFAADGALPTPMVLLGSYGVNAVAGNYMTTFHHRVVPLVVGLLRSLVLPVRVPFLSSSHPGFGGFPPALFVVLVVATMNLKKFRANLGLFSLYCAGLALVAINDVWWMGSVVSDEVRHAREGYAREWDHNWIWKDELSPWLWVY